MRRSVKADHVGEIPTLGATRLRVISPYHIRGLTSFYPSGPEWAKESGHFYVYRHK